MVDINLVKLGDSAKINFKEVNKDSILPAKTIKDLKLFDKRYSGIHKITKITKGFTKNNKIELEEDYWFFPNELDLIK